MRKMFVFSLKIIPMQTIQGDGFSVLVIKSDRRKTTALKIKDGEVSIHIPKRLPLSIASDFVRQKTPWIQQKLQHQPSIAERHFISGESLLFLGQQFNFQLISNEGSDTIIKTVEDIQLHGRLNRLSKAAIRSRLITWYKQQATLYLSSRTAHYSAITGLKPRSITIKTYRSRWGSCGVYADIQFNWKLMLAPPQIIDYVIVHELCHIEQHNHSAAFWQLVKRHYPDFKTARLWLKNNGYTLNL